MFFMSSPNRLKEIRLRRGYTLTRLAQETKIDKSNLHLIETGRKKGTPNAWLKLASALRVPVSDLFITNTYPNYPSNRSNPRNPTIRKITKN